MAASSEGYGREVVEKYDNLYKGCLGAAVFDFFGISLFPSDLRGLSIADFGCGPGHFFIECRKRGATRLVGYDISADMLAMAAENEIKQFGDSAIEFKKCDCFAPIQFETTDFDISTSHFLLPHCPNRTGMEALCGNLFNCLKPGGTTLLTTIPYYVSGKRGQDIYARAFGYRPSIRPSVLDSIVEPEEMYEQQLKMEIDENGQFKRFTDEVEFEYKDFLWKKRSIVEAMEKTGFRNIRQVFPSGDEDIEDEATKMMLGLDHEDIYIKLMAEK